MESQTECEIITNEDIQNTSQPGDEQPGDEQPTHTKPTDSEPKIDHGAGKSSQLFTLLDLRRLTFTLDGEHVLNAQDATHEEFDALARVVSNVTNVEQWYLEERRDFINGLLAFCQARNYPFPFTIVDEETESTMSPVEPAQEGTGQEMNAQQNNAKEEPGDAFTDESEMEMV
jgi:hypothetical protein